VLGACANHCAVVSHTPPHTRQEGVRERAARDNARSFQVQSEHNRGTGTWCRRCGSIALEQFSHNGGLNVARATSRQRRTVLLPRRSFIMAPLAATR
jgi:hypothetical protein